MVAEVLPLMKGEATHRKLRILCLHGYHGSADILRRQMEPLISQLPPLAEFVFANAPSLARKDFGWWHARQPPFGGSIASADQIPDVRYEGWEETRAWTLSTFSGQALAGIFGFSQGAALAGLLVGLRSSGNEVTPERPLQFQFAMLAGGFISNDPAHAVYYASEGFNMPSLHMIGDRDGVVSPSASQALAARFKDPVVIQHELGHVIASDSQSVEKVSAFLEGAINARIRA
jgi:pimeloyl-ACP methyl ester carboxylesterase